MNLDDKLFLDRYRTDDRPHISIIDRDKCKLCRLQPCLYTCPADCYKMEGDEIRFSFEGCLECGSCRIICSESKNISWSYPRGGFGISYKFG